MTQEEMLSYAIEFLSQIGQYQKFEDWLLAKGYSQDEIDDCQQWENMKYLAFSKLESQFHQTQEELSKAKESINSLFDAIKHGDQEHQDWLEEKIKAHFKGIKNG